MMLKLMLILSSSLALASTECCSAHEVDLPCRSKPTRSNPSSRLSSASESKVAARETPHSALSEATGRPKPNFHRSETVAVAAGSLSLAFSSEINCRNVCEPVI